MPGGIRRESYRAHAGKVGAVLLVFIAAVALVQATASGGNVSPATFLSPTHGTLHAQNVTFNVSANNTTDYVEIHHNQSTSFPDGDVVWNISDDHATNASSNSTHDFFFQDFNTTALDDGLVGFNATAYNETPGGDATYSLGWETITLYIDNYPNVTVNEPEDNANVSGELTLNATADDQEGFTFTYRWEYYVNGSNATTWLPLDDSLTVDTFDTTDLPDGRYNLTFNATDDIDLKNLTNVTNVHIDNTIPNGTDDLNLSDANHSALQDWSSVTGLSRFLDDSLVTLNWTGFTVSDEITDSGDNQTGVEDLELWARDRSYNTSTQEMNNWSAWYRENEAINASWQAVNGTNVSLTSDHQYEFNLSTVDWANNTNGSNIINVTVDDAGPVFATNASGDDIYTRWVNASNTSWANASSPVSANITDLAGINRSSIAGYVNGTHVADQNLTITPGTDTENASEYLVTLSGTGLWDLSNMTSNTNITINASDTLGNTNTSMRWNLSTDFNAPDTVETKTDWESADNDDGWYKDSVLVGVTKCTDEAGSSESGVDAVAAFVDDERVTDWNTSVNDTGAANLTLTENGDNTYTFACRDVAGNINDTVTADVAIDANDPQVDDSDASPTDDTDRSFTMDIEVGEDDESGVNVSASTLTLDGDDGTIDDIDWANDTIEVEISGLSFNEGYDLDGDVVDMVGHEASVTIDFDTRSNNQEEEEAETTSGGGGGTLVDSMDFVGLTDTLSMTPGSTESTEFTVENDGDLNLESIDISVDVDDLDVSVSPDGFDLDSGDDEDVTLEVTAADDAATGVYAAEVTAEAEEDTTASESFDIEVVVDGPAFSVTDRPDAIDVTRGNDTSVSVTVENTGSQDAENVQFSIGAFNLTAGVTPTSTDLDQDASTTVQITVNETDAEVGVYPLTFIVSSGDAETTATLDIKVQPASEAEEQRIAQELESLRSRVADAAAGNNTTDSELSSLVTEAETAIEEGDYARAAELHRQIEQQLPGGGGLPLLLIVGILVFGLIAGGAIYLSMVSEEGDDYGSYSSDLGPVRASQESYSYHDHSFLDRVTALFRNGWLYIDSNVLHHSRKASAKAQAHLDEFRQQATRQAQRRGRGGDGRDVPRGGDFDEQDGN